MCTKKVFSYTISFISYTVVHVAVNKLFTTHLRITSRELKRKVSDLMFVHDLYSSGSYFPRILELTNKIEKSVDFFFTSRDVFKLKIYKGHKIITNCNSLVFYLLYLVFLLSRFNCVFLILLVSIKTMFYRMFNDFYPFKIYLNKQTVIVVLVVLRK